MKPRTAQEWVDAHIYPVPSHDPVTGEAVLVLHLDDVRVLARKLDAAIYAMASTQCDFDLRYEQYGDETDKEKIARMLVRFTTFFDELGIGL